MEKTIKILLVEKIEKHTDLLKSSLEDLKINFELIAVENKEDALDKLKEQNNGNAFSFIPDLIIIALDMSDNKSIGLLEEIKSDENLKSIPVIIFSSSHASENVNQAYMLHANCYVHKPENEEDFKKAVEDIWNFWINIVRLPSAERKRMSYFNS